MHTKLKRISCFSCLMALMIFISGCENQSEVIKETNVVKAFKIEKKEKIEKTVNGEADLPVSSVPLNAKKAEAVREERQQIQNEKSIPAPAFEAPLGELITIEEAPKENESVLSSGDSEMNSGENHDKMYNSEGRIDPFAPLFRNSSEVVDSYNKPLSAREARLGRLTPLEKLDLSQLKLTGILYLPSAQRSMAMVEEATGKGHVIKKGTYIGVNSGRVIGIQKNVVVIEEEVENYMGDIVVRKRELKLQKPLGER